MTGAEIFGSAWLSFGPDGVLAAGDPRSAAEAHDLLVAAGLAPLGPGDARVELLVVEREGGVVACGGFETHGEAALIRSVAVAADARGAGLGRTLVARLLERLAAHGCRDVVLLTESAEGFFATFGFRALPRAELPGAVRRSRQLSEGCCALAVAMRLTRPDSGGVALPGAFQSPDGETEPGVPAPRR